MKLSARQIKGFIKNSSSKANAAKEKGFTLIELLVVIGILGILAAALVATIDPFEQLQKATDSRRQNMAVEFLNANIRYYTTQSSFPWNDDGNSGTNCYDNLTSPLDGIALDNENMAGDEGDCINILAEHGELKGSFDTNTNDLGQVYFSWDESNATDLVVCYAPVSRSQKGGQDTIYTAPDGETTSDQGDGTCPNPEADDGVCYWCTR